MSEGDSVGDSVHGKPSVVYRFFTRLGQVGAFVDQCEYLGEKFWLLTHPQGCEFAALLRRDKHELTLPDTVLSAGL